MSDLALDIRQAIQGEELDYPLLMHLLAGYRNPRAKVTDLLRKGWLVRIKKGLYVLGPKLARRRYSREVLANLIYGPSCLSMHSALAWHGLIPEAVTQVTSVTPLRDKRFQTPAGVFTYRHLGRGRYPTGIGLERLPDGTPFLLASPEKALADWLLLQPGHPVLDTPVELLAYLEADLRVSPEALARLDPARLRDLALTYRHPRVALLAALPGETHPERGPR